MNPALVEYLRDYTNVALSNPTFTPSQVTSQVGVGDGSFYTAKDSTDGSLAASGNAATAGTGKGATAQATIFNAFTSRLVQRCADPESGGAAFVPWRGEVALLFVDLSGYSKAAAILAPKGAHALSAVVNGYFSSIVECVIKKHGGDVLTFAGDAVMAVWPQDISGTEGAQECCYAALLCANDLQSNHSAWPIPDSTQQFRLHIGMTFGEMEVDVFLASNAKAMQRAFPFMTGDLLMRIGDIVNGAKAGEIAIDSKVFEICNSLVHCTPLPDDKSIFTVDVVEADELSEALQVIRVQESYDQDEGAKNQTQMVSPKLFIHPAIVRRLQFAANVTQMSELRFLCVLFIVKDCPTNTGDWFLEVQEVLDRNRCPVIQVIDDDKGTHIVAAVNLFVAESHPVDTAVRCAQMLISREVGCVIGMAAGEVLCGCVGGEQSTRWDITGTPCVRACRLMQAAITMGLPFLTDGSVYSKLRSVTPLDRVAQSISVKGSSAPVALYELHKGGIVQAADSLVALGTHPQCYTLYQGQLLNCHTVLTANGVQRPIVAVNGTIASGKRTLCKIALRQDRHILFEHTSMPNSAPLSVGRTVADWFTHHADQSMSQLAKDCQKSLESGHMSKSLGLLLAIVDMAISSGSFMCLLIHHAQFLDPGSLSFVRAVIQSSRTSGTGQWSICLTTVPLFGAPTLQDVIHQLHRGVPPQARRPIPTIELRSMTLEDVRALWRKTGIWSLSDDCAVAVAEKVGYCPGFIPVLQAFLEGLYLHARTEDAEHKFRLDEWGEAASSLHSHPGAPEDSPGGSNNNNSSRGRQRIVQLDEWGEAASSIYSHPGAPDDSPSESNTSNNTNSSRGRQRRGTPTDHKVSQLTRHMSSFATRKLAECLKSTKIKKDDECWSTESKSFDASDAALPDDLVELGSDISIGRNGTVRFGARAEIQLRRLSWTTVSPEMLSRVALLYDSLEPNLQLLLRVLTSLVHKSELRRMPAVPEYVLVTVCMKVSGHSGTTEDQFRTHLDQLVEYLILEETPEAKDPTKKRYRFRLPALEESVYRLLTPEQIKSLCRHAARVFGTKWKVESPNDQLLRAELWAKAHIPEKGCEALEKAWSLYTTEPSRGQPLGSLVSGTSAVAHIDADEREQNLMTLSGRGRPDCLERSIKDLQIDGESTETRIFAHACARIAEKMDATKRMEGVFSAQTPNGVPLPSCDMTHVPFTTADESQGGEQSLPLLTVKNFSPPLALGPIAGYSVLLALAVLPESVRVVGADPKAVSNPQRVSVVDYMQLVRMFESFVPTLTPSVDSVSDAVAGTEKNGTGSSGPKAANTGDEASLMQEEVLMLAALSAMQSTAHADTTAVELLEYFTETSAVRAARVKAFARTRDAARLVKRATQANPLLEDDEIYHGLVKAYNYLVNLHAEFKGADENDSLSDTDFEVALMDLASVGFDFMYNGLVLEGFQLHEVRNSILREQSDVYDFISALFIFILDRSNASENQNQLRKRDTVMTTSVWEEVEKRNMYDVERLGEKMTIVIGGSQPGLAAAYQLKQQGLPYVVLERANTVAATWYSRWDSFRLVTPNRMLSLPGFDWEANELDPAGYASKTALLKYLETYRKKLDLDVRFGIRVLDAAQRPDGQWTVCCDVHGTTKSFTTNNVIVASGNFQTGKISRISKRLSSDIVQLHSSQYKNPRQLIDGAVLIVGSAQSGMCIGTELCEAGRKVFISCGKRAGRLPFVYGQCGYTWAQKMGLFDTKAEDLPSDEARRDKRVGPNPSILPGRSVSLRDLAAKHGLVPLGRVQTMSGYTIELAAGVGETMNFIEQYAKDFHGKVDEFLAKEKASNNGVMPKHLREFDNRKEAQEEFPRCEAELDPILKLDLRKEGITNIIWCTGFTPSVDKIIPKRPELFDSDGYPNQSRGVAQTESGQQVSGLYYLGLPWMYKWKSALLCGVGEDAEFVAKHIKEREQEGASKKKVVSNQHLVPVKPRESRVPTMNPVRSGGTSLVLNRKTPTEKW